MVKKQEAPASETPEQVLAGPAPRLDLADPAGFAPLLPVLVDFARLYPGEMTGAVAVSVAREAGMHTQPHHAYADFDEAGKAAWNALAMQAVAEAAKQNPPVA